jgi:hypothetical protein
MMIEATPDSVGRLKEQQRIPPPLRVRAEMPKVVWGLIFELVVQRQMVVELFWTFYMGFGEVLCVIWVSSSLSSIPSGSQSTLPLTRSTTETLPSIIPKSRRKISRIKTRTNRKLEAHTFSFSTDSAMR